KNLFAKLRRLWTADPLADRRGESSFRQLPKRTRETTTRERAQDALSLPANLFSRRWNPERQFDDPAIEQRTTDLERVRHAHAIDFYKRIIRQVDFQVRILCPLHGISR